MLVCAPLSAELAAAEPAVVRLDAEAAVVLDAADVADAADASAVALDDVWVWLEADAVGVSGVDVRVVAASMPAAVVWAADGAFDDDGDTVVSGFVALAVGTAAAVPLAVAVTATGSDVCEAAVVVGAVADVAFSPGVITTGRDACVVTGGIVVREMAAVLLALLPLLSDTGTTVRGMGMVEVMGVTGSTVRMDGLDSVGTTDVVDVSLVVVVAGVVAVVLDVSLVSRPRLTVDWSVTCGRYDDRGVSVSVVLAAVLLSSTWRGMTGRRGSRRPKEPSGLASAAATRRRRERGCMMCCVC